MGAAGLKDWPGKEKNGGAVWRKRRGKWLPFGLCLWPAAVERNSNHMGGLLLVEIGLGFLYFFLVVKIAPP